MKRVTTLTAVLFAMALLASAAPASSRPAASEAAPYRYYVACGLSQSAKPSHRCRRRQQKGAFFRSNVATVRYTVCVRFPTGRTICTRKPKKAAPGLLYVNEITSNITGKHQVTWFVAGKRVGSFYFTVYR